MINNLGLLNNASLTRKKKRVSDRLLKALIIFCAALTVAILVTLIIYIFARGVSQISWEFLSTATSVIKKRYGILPSIINTLYIIVITLVIATPVGIGAAIFLSEYAKKGKIVRMIEFTIETLAGIPSIIYGLFGAIFFGQLMKMGYSILAGSLTLTLMILPLIIRTTQEAIKTVPESYREGALGIGATKWYMIRTVILPSSLNGIITAVILAIGRIVGESAALIFTAGSAANLPVNWLTHPMNSGATMTVQMYFGVTSGKYIDESFGIALILIIIVLLINLSTRLISRKYKKSNQK